MTAQADRDGWIFYIDAILEDWAEHSGQRALWTVEQMPAADVDDVWDTGALRAVGRDPRPARAAFIGRWNHVAPYLTVDFREWLEYGRRRLTFSEWKAAQVQARKETAQAERDYLDSADHCLDRLEAWAAANRERDSWIVSARVRGASFKEIMAASGLTRMTVYNVIERARRAHVDIIAEAEAIVAEASEPVWGKVF